VRLHVLAGSRDLLRPESLPGISCADLLGPGIRVATAFWLSRRCGNYYHDFLVEDLADRRVEAFALSLRDNFGRRFEPLVILPELLMEPAMPIPVRPAPLRAGEVARLGSLDVMREVWRHDPADGLVLHALALPAAVDADGSWARAAELLAPEVDGRLDGLRAAFAAAGIDPDLIETRVTEAPLSSPDFDVLLRNAVAGRIARRAREQLAPDGLGTDPDLLEVAMVRVLRNWSRSGILPARAPLHALGAGDLDRLAGRVTERLLASDLADA
jgi:hypothetical protein